MEHFPLFSSSQPFLVALNLVLNLHLALIECEWLFLFYVGHDSFRTFCLKAAGVGAEPRDRVGYGDITTRGHYKKICHQLLQYALWLCDIHVFFFTGSGSPED